MFPFRHPSTNGTSTYVLNHARKAGHNPAQVILNQWHITHPQVLPPNLGKYNFQTSLKSVLEYCFSFFLINSYSSVNGTKDIPPENLSLCCDPVTTRHTSIFALTKLFYTFILHQSGSFLKPEPRSYIFTEVYMLGAVLGFQKKVINKINFLLYIPTEAEKCSTRNK